MEQIIELDLDEKSKGQFNNSVLAVEELIKKCKKLLV
jgi:malate/lactate dehydrogenase